MNSVLSGSSILSFRPRECSTAPCRKRLPAGISSFTRRTSDGNTVFSNLGAAQHLVNQLIIVRIIGLLRLCTPIPKRLVSCLLARGNKEGQHYYYVE